MRNKWKIYKVSGKVAFFVDDLMAPSKKTALETAIDSIDDQVSFAANQGDIELLELDAEPLRAATKEEVVDGFGEEEWKD